MTTKSWFVEFAEVGRADRDKVAELALIVACSHLRPDQLREVAEQIATSRDSLKRRAEVARDEQVAA